MLSFFFVLPLFFNFFVFSILRRRPISKRERPLFDALIERSPPPPLPYGKPVFFFNSASCLWRNHGAREATFFFPPGLFGVVNAPLSRFSPRFLSSFRSDPGPGGIVLLPSSFFPPFPLESPKDRDLRDQLPRHPPHGSLSSACKILSLNFVVPFSRLLCRRITGFFWMRAQRVNPFFFCLLPYLWQLHLFFSCYPEEGESASSWGFPFSRSPFPSSLLERVSFVFEFERKFSFPSCVPFSPPRFIFFLLLFFLDFLKAELGLHV